MNSSVTPPVKHGDVGRRLVENMENMTADRIRDRSLTNARANVRYLENGRSIAALKGQKFKPKDSAVIIAAGPSIRHQDPIKAIKKVDYGGAIIATESAMRYCLQNDVMPDLVVSVDPLPGRIIRWFGDPELTQDMIEQDDYYRRQDMDTGFARELETNREMIELIDRNAGDMRIALASCTSDQVIRRVVRAGMQIFWWNPMLDDPDEQTSVTRELYRLNKLPCINAGGNVGAASWMIACEVLGIKHVALTGMDFSYYSDTPYTATQYYHEAVDLVGEAELDSIFMWVHNPHIDTWFYTDPAYMWYRECFLEMAAESESLTYNCTGGGILFGEHINFQPLEDFLSSHG